MRFSREFGVGLFVISALAVLLFVSMKVGVVRFFQGNYNRYIVYAQDVSGLLPHSDIKIAGVKIGYIDSLDLQVSAHQVKLAIAIKRDIPVYKDAYFTVRQDSVLGAKYLELFTGTIENGLAMTGEILSMPLKVSVAFDAVVGQLQDASNYVCQLMGTAQQATGEAVEQSQGMMGKITDALGAITSCVQKLQAVVDENQKQVATVIERMHQMSEPAVGVVESVSRGEGTVGKLLCDDSLYNAVCSVAHSVDNSVSWWSRLRWVGDGHTESMCNTTCPSGVLPITNMKGYLNLRLCTGDDYYFMAGLVASRQGIVKRKQLFNTVCLNGMPDNSEFYPSYVYQQEVRPYALTFNAQFAKLMGHFALRGGFIESTIGLGVDMNIPLYRNSRWVCTLEAFDFTGQYRIDDHAPHLTWRNYLFFTPTVYAAFGIDDFISKHNKAAFVGIGIRYYDFDTGCAIP